MYSKYNNEKKEAFILFVTILPVHSLDHASTVTVSVDISRSQSSLESG